MNPLSRRDLLSAAAVLSLGGGVSAAAAATEPPGADPAPILPKAFLGKHTPQQLAFDPTKLDGLSEKLIRSHWENNYQGAINALNVWRDVDRAPAELRDEIAEKTHALIDWARAGDNAFARTPVSTDDGAHDTDDPFTALGL